MGLNVAALLFTLTALAAWANEVWLRWPRAPVLLVFGLLVSLGAIGIDIVFPGLGLHTSLARALAHVDFYSTFINGILAFLLFAGALQVDLVRLRSRRWGVILLATAGTILSTVLVGAMFWYCAGLLGLGISLAWALVFGALISPSDPIAVLATLKSSRLPQGVRITMEGEALFNDGIGVVLFVTLLHIASGQSLTFGDVITQFAQETGGGILLGLVAGYIAYLAMGRVDEYGTEVLVTVALVTGTYSLALQFGISGPIAVVTAGILTGNRGKAHAISENTWQHLGVFWSVLDEVLNAALFLFIGLEILSLKLISADLWLGGISVMIVLLARFLSVSAGLGLLSWRTPFQLSGAALLTWGAVRGGISVALALSLPGGPRTSLLAATYSVVLFSVIVQGLTLRRVADWVSPPQIRTQ